MFLSFQYIDQFFISKELFISVKSVKHLHLFALALLSQIIS